jgi:DNA helicase-2/ATP-dependent DNA helicase PcrA
MQVDIHAEYQKQYTRLTKTQKLAVDTLDGPVMVIAGPGTGKTTILTLRIATILLKTDTPPDAILALTFTESGARAMRAKLHGLIGAQAHRVVISTFHGFAQSLLSQSPELFPRISRGALVSDVEIAGIIEKILLENSFSAIKPFGDPTNYLSSCVSTIKTLKREAISVEGFKAMIELQEKDIRSREDLVHTKGGHKGKMKSQYKVILERIERNRELARVYELYEDALVKQGFYDFEDLIAVPIARLASDPDYKQIVQEKFLYIMADEHQDTNGAQNEILKLLTDYDPRPNIFVVGDDKQAIFRFQGATLANFQGFSKTFADATRIALSDNFRSPQSVLDGAHELISNNPSIEEGERTRLISQVSVGTEPIQVVACQNKTHELSYLAGQIKKLCDEGVVPLHEIAVLYRDNKDAQDIASALSKYGVRAHIESNMSIFENEVTALLMGLLRVIANPLDDGAVTKLLFSPLTTLTVFEVRALLESARKAKKPLLEILQTEESPAQSLARTCGELAREAQVQNLSVLFERIIKETGFLAYVLTQNTVLDALAHIEVVFALIKNLSTRKLTFIITDFLAHIDTSITHGYPIKIPATTQENSVRLMTAHASKGLEFKYVFVAHVTESKWGKRPNRSRFYIPEIGETTENERTEDERRLMYVALTRAQVRATLTYTVTGADGKEELPSQFVSELDPSTVCTVIAPALTRAEEVLLVREAIVESPQARASEKLLGLVASQGISVTALNNFNSCAWKYFFVNLIRLPQSPSRAQSYGTAIHYALERFASQLRNGKRLSQEEFVQNFVDKVALELDLVLRSEIEEKGRQALMGFYEEELINLPDSTHPEYRAERTYTSDGLSLRLVGMIDRIDRGEGGVCVVDYKTGKVKSRNHILGKTQGEGSGDYWRQLLFYKLLLQEHQEYSPDRGMILFVEPEEGEYTREVFDLQGESTEPVEMLIHSLVSTLRTGSFASRACNKKECEFCTLSRHLRM